MARRVEPATGSITEQFLAAVDAGEDSEVLVGEAQTLRMVVTSLTGRGIELKSYTGSAQ